MGDSASQGVFGKRHITGEELQVKFSQGFL